MCSAPRVLIAAESLLPVASGIGRVARLTTRVLAEMAQGGELQLRAIALRDSIEAGDLDVPIIACGGSRLRFVFECQRAALHCSHFVYDFAGMARAHPGWFRPRRLALVWMHGIEVWEDARADRLRALARADVLVSNTAYTRARADALHGGFARADTCWLGTESDAVPAPPLVPLNSPHVLILGRIDPAGGYKGHRELIDAWPEVVRAVPHARLLIAGGGPAQELVERWVEQSPVRTHIELLEFVPEHRLEALWARASVFAMPSRGEGLGLAFIEAMRHGLPVIGTVHDAASEINEHGVTGYNVDLREPHALASRLIELCRDHALAHRLGEAGRARWQAQFRYSSFRERMQPILRRFLERR